MGFCFYPENKERLEIERGRKLGQEEALKKDDGLDL